MHLYDLFRNVLRLFPELSRYSIVFEAFESEPGFSAGEVRGCGNSFVVRLATNMVEDGVHASFVIAHELAHILVNPHNIPVEGKKWEPKDFIELLEQSIEDVVCDWIALKRLEHYYRGDLKKLRRLYGVYLNAVSVEGYVALAEDLKYKVISMLKETYPEEVKKLLETFFMNLPLEDLEKMNFLAVLALSKYVMLPS